MQKIFLSYHFDDRVEPIVKRFMKLISSHDLVVKDGKRLQGQLLIDKVHQKIVASDAVIIFLTKREAGKTNDWVNHERSTAQALGKPFIAIIEKGLANASPFELKALGTPSMFA